MFPEPNVRLLPSSSCCTHSVRTLAFEARRSPWRPGIRSVALGLLLLGHVVLAGGRHVAAAEEKELFACTFQNTRACQTVEDDRRHVASAGRSSQTAGRGPR